MPTTSRLSKATGHVPAPVVRPMQASGAERPGVSATRRAAGLTYIVAYALLPLVIALGATALLHDWGHSPASTVPLSAGGARISDSTHLVPANAVAAGTTQARAGSGESERPGNPGAERLGESAATPLSSPLGQR
jgi:hypothetical protein